MPRRLGMHFGTFRMTVESIDVPLVALEQAKREHHLGASEFTTLEFVASAVLHP